MRFLALASVLLLSACVSTPEPEPVALPAAVAPRPPVSGALIGRTSAELVARFGTPQFQVREASGLKLQWSSASCILDVYLYPPVGSAVGERAVHADARRADGGVVEVNGCAGSFGIAR